MSDYLVSCCRTIAREECRDSASHRTDRVLFIFKNIYVYINDVAAVIQFLIYFSVRICKSQILPPFALPLVRDDIVAHGDGFSEELTRVTSFSSSLLLNLYVNAEVADCMSSYL